VAALTLSLIEGVVTTSI